MKSRIGAHGEQKQKNKRIDLDVASHHPDTGSGQSKYWPSVAKVAGPRKVLGGRTLGH